MQKDKSCVCIILLIFSIITFFSFNLWLLNHAKIILNVLNAWHYHSHVLKRNYCSFGKVQCCYPLAPLKPHQSPCFTDALHDLMADSSNYSLFLDNLFFEKPVVHKVWVKRPDVLIFIWSSQPFIILIIIILSTMYLAGSPSKRR